MNKEMFLITIISSLISGILGVLISIYYHKKSERYSAKMETLKRFVSYRYDIEGENFTRALNEIFISFQDSKEVIKRLSDFHDVIVSKDKELANDKLVLLFKSMCSDLNINSNNFSESLFMKPFNIRN